ncbi:MAG: APC family permease [Acetilactobacillus jinshanensis]
MLCFVGFEVACTVATRTILGGMVIFVFVSYAVVIGFGTERRGLHDLRLR